MRKFQNITFAYKGDNLTIKSNEVFLLVQQLHEIIPLSFIVNPIDENGKQRFSVFDTCEAFACCVNYAGGQATQEEIYCELFGENPIAMEDLILRIQMVVVPPEEFIVEQSDNEELKKK